MRNALAFLFTIIPGIAPAQTTVTLRLPVKDVMFLTSTSSTLTLSTPTQAVYDGTVTVVTGPALTVQSNRAWKVTLTSVAAFAFANAGGTVFPNPAKPATDVSWAVTTSPFTASGTLGIAGANVAFAGATGSAASYAPTASATATLYFRASWLQSRDVPGVYTLSTSLTLRTP
jgi:hypothetical protein